jgi:hypothetical protein
MDAHTWERPYVALDAMTSYDAIDPEVARSHGHIVKAAGISNVDYKLRFERYGKERSMQPPPSCGRIFPGYVVVRRLGTSGQYETWMPEHVFEDLYRGIG